MKNFLSLFIFLLLVNISFSQQYWTEQNSGVTTTLTSVSVPNCAGTVWVCGYSGVVLRTSNSGSNWINVSGNGIPNNIELINICGIDCNTALVAGYLGTNTWVWKTTNSGANWIQVFTQPNGFIDAIRYKYSNANKIIMVGDPVGGRWSLWKSTNFGGTWDSTGMYLPQSGNESGYNNSLYWNYSPYGIPDSSIWFGTNNSKIYRSTNNGANWVAISTGTELNSYAVMTMDNDILVGGATLLRSNNLGNNWSTVSAPGTGNFGGLVIFLPGVDNINNVGACWFIRSDNKIYNGSDGSNWSVQYTAPAGNFRYISTAGYDGPIWAVRDNGGISACVGCFVSGVVPTSGEIPANYSLKQNYPNPFNPITTFEFSIPTASHVKLCIYNSLGEQVDLLTESSLNAGTYSINWDASRFASGIYFYTLFAGSEGKTYTNTKKMVLVK